MAALLLRLHLMEFCHCGPDAHGKPGGEDKRSEQREQHGHGAEGRDRFHVGSHHTADKPHRQQGGNNGKGRQDGWIADLPHRINGGIRVHITLLKPAPVDVLHHYNSVIDQDTDRKDQGEQTDPVDGIAHDPGHKDGDQDDHRDDKQDDDGRANTQCVPDQQTHDSSSDKQLEDQLIDLVVGCLAIVAGNVNINVIRYQTPLQLFNLVNNGIGHGDTVGALFLGDGNRDTGQAVGRIPTLIGGAGIELDQLAGFRRGLEDTGHVTHIDRHIVLHSDNKAGDIFSSSQERAGINGKVLVTTLNRACTQLIVCRADGVGHLVKADAVAGEALRANLDTHLLGSASHDKTLTGVGNLLQALQHIKRQGAQYAIINIG